MIQNLKYELKAKKKYSRIAGVDEVGRGCLAGPVVACAVIINDFEIELIKELDDSKKISSKKEKYYLKK